MKIIFLGTTGVHRALIAAHIYLNKLETNDFTFVEGFCDVMKDRSGFPIYIGDDENGNQVYTLGGGNDLPMVEKSISDLVSIFGFSSNELQVKSVNGRGDLLISIVSKIPPILVGSQINYLVSNFIIKQDFNQIFEDVEEFRTEFIENTF
ncbi:MAG: DUF3189 family protein [Syntrophomonadaceae bacterium]|nr:DUF3189 family protein [Syntrophomonadaceae bacterium]MDD3889362.1 DUF3189 family protein [Syntrophomonadaceae bacterium]MDD4548585.1 DUF3189 family protein [Syntrophomonadaceae bacterium]